MTEAEMLTRMGEQLGRLLARLTGTEITADTPRDDVIANDQLIPTYKQTGQYHAGDVRTDPETRQPHRCILDYDADLQPDWNLQTPTLWIPYHGTDRDSAYPWAEPTGAHDMYKAGEYMTYTDGLIYRCIADTNFSPEAYGQAWEKVPE